MTKKLYNCPAVEVVTIQATYNLLGASKPFTGSETGADGSQPIY